MPCGNVTVLGERNHYLSASVYEIRGFHFIWSDIHQISVVQENFVYCIVLIKRNGTLIGTASVTL